MEAALKIDGATARDERGLNEHTAALLRDIIFSDMDQEDKDRAIAAVEKCSATVVQDCTFETKEVNKMTFWEMIHKNWLGGKPISRWT
ncbi:hypothetical protein [Tritonibacter mobilis]|uniref:hypothetical protein n=1 Tax=Tritonibacter mobilis TaxID=379347 RepID=UPI0039A72F6F